MQPCKTGRGLRRNGIGIGRVGSSVRFGQGEMALENPHRALDAIRSDPGCVAGADVVHEGDPRAGSEVVFLEVVGMADVNEEPAPGDVLKVGDRTVSRVMGGIVQAALLMG